MSRRQTLAGFSPSQLNSKAAGNNAGPGRGLKDGAIPSKARKSLAPSMLLGGSAGVGVDRRSSVIGTKPGCPKQDPRPLNNKDYQAAIINNIITYLTTHRFPGAVSPKTLASPTGKDFATMITFLIQQFDPTYKPGKLEDDVPAFFKRLNYPFAISKSSLFAVGAPHSWPPVLGAMAWLVDLLTYQEKLEARSGQSSGQDDKQSIVKYLTDNYCAFMSGNDTRCVELDEELKETFITRAGNIGKRTNENRAETARLRAEIEHLRSLPDPVAEAQQKHADKITDKQKLEQLLAQQQAHVQSLTRKLSEKKSELQATQDQVVAAVSEAEQLRQRVASQGINKADENRLVMERRKQAEMLEMERSKCDEMERKVHDLEMQLHQFFTGLETSVAKYNDLAHRLKLIPSTSKRAAGRNFELQIDRDAKTLDKFASLDLKTGLKPAIERLYEEYYSRTKQLSQDILGLRETLQARTERNLETQTESTRLAEEVTAMEAHLQSTKENIEDKCRRLAAQADDMKVGALELRSAASGRVEQMGDRLSRAQAAYEQAKRDAEAEVSRVQADVNTATQMIRVHKETLTNALLHAASVVRQRKQELISKGA